MSDQIKRHFSLAEAKVQSVVQSFDRTTTSIKTLEEGNHEQIKTAAEKAYGALENVVRLLLKVDDGNQRLSRLDASIIPLLQDSIQNFENLCTLSRENKYELGMKGGDCKQLGDGATRLSHHIAGRAAGLNMEASAAWQTRAEYINKWHNFRNSEDSLRRQVEEKQSSVNDIGNAFLSFFNSNSGDMLRTQLKDAQYRLSRNIEDQWNAKQTAEQFYQVAIIDKNASAAYMALKQRLEKIGRHFAQEFVQVIEAQNVETKLWTGLLDLKNKIWSTDYTSTRDRSLGQILRLLTLDDEVFMRQSFFEDTELRIKDAIVRKLGGDAVKRLIAGPVQREFSDSDIDLS